jgi:hypothetical protein
MDMTNRRVRSPQLRPFNGCDDEAGVLNGNVCSRRLFVSCPHLGQILVQLLRVPNMDPFLERNHRDSAAFGKVDLRLAVDST